MDDKDLIEIFKSLPESNKNVNLSEHQVRFKELIEGHGGTYK